jgi:hypothetical protein
LTFDEWVVKSSFVEPDPGVYQWLKDCWEAAQANVSPPAKKIPAILKKKQ